MSLQVFKRKPFLFLYGVGVVLLLTAGWLWWNRLSTDPQRVFWGMIEQSMKTSAVTVQASQTNNGTTFFQTIQYSLGGQNYTHSLTTLTQAGTTVQDEMIGTPAADFTRYANIKTDQKTASGKPLNVSQILGVWAKSPNTANRSALLSQAVLGTGLPLGGVAVPIGNLSPTLRQQLYDQIKKNNVYTVSFDNVQKAHKDGRLLYTYVVSLKPDRYANMMRSYAKDIGLHDLDNLDPANYQGQPAFSIKLTVDVHARQLITAEATTTNIKQTYSSYDIPVTTPLPAKTITSAELQKRLQKMQQ